MDFDKLIILLLFFKVATILGSSLLIKVDVEVIIDIDDAVSTQLDDVIDVKDSVEALLEYVDMMDIEATRFLSAGVGNFVKDAVISLL